MHATRLTKHEEKRREILDAAQRAFVRDGLQGASIAAICREARISPGHLYHYFDSREAILEAIAESYLANLQVQFNAALASGRSASAVITEIERTVDASGASDHVLLFDLFAQASRNTRIAEILSNATAGMQSLLTSFLADAQAQGDIARRLDPEAAAMVIINIMDAAKASRIRGAHDDSSKVSLALATMIGRYLADPGE